MGLKFESDLAAWRSWQSSRYRVRSAWRGLRKEKRESLALLIRGAKPRLLIGLDSLSPTSVSSMLEPLSHWAEDIAILMPAQLLGDLDISWVPDRIEFLEKDELLGEEKLPGLAAVTSIGNYLPVGLKVFGLAQRLNIPFVVVQHGLLSPFSPPLPDKCHLLAFTNEDAQFWIGSRTDVSYEVVGMQSFWRASLQNRPDVADSTPVFLGQLHGSELKRRIAIGSATAFCLETGATYRPHPSETDLLSRLQHKKWMRMGIDVDFSKTPLKSLNRPVASVFSTGILEATAVGLPAWGYAINEPAWVREFWKRYNIAVWGSGSTVPPVKMAEEPALAVAKQLERIVLNNN